MKNLGTAHPATFIAMQELVASYSVAGRREEAIGVKRKVVERHKQTSDQMTLLPSAPLPV